MLTKQEIMKTKGMIIATLVLSLVFGANVFASDNSAIAKAHNQLKVQLQKEFKTLPFDEISGLEKCAIVEVSFKINENNELEVIEVHSTNEDLQRHAEIALKDNKVVADDLLQGESYHVKMRFIVKS